MSTVMEVLIVEDEMLLAIDIEAMVEDSGHHALAEVACLAEVMRSQTILGLNSPS